MISGMYLFGFVTPLFLVIVLVNSDNYSFGLLINRSFRIRLFGLITLFNTIYMLAYIDWESFYGIFIGAGHKNRDKQSLLVVIR